MSYELFYKYRADELPSKYEIEKNVIGNYSITNIKENIFEVDHWTSMFNNISDDVPKWMINLTDLHNIDSDSLLSNYGFKNIKFKIESEG